MLRTGWVCLALAAALAAGQRASGADGVPTMEACYREARAEHLLNQAECWRWFGWKGMAWVTYRQALIYAEPGSAAQCRANRDFARLVRHWDETDISFTVIHGAFCIVQCSVGTEPIPAPLTIASPQIPLPEFKVPLTETGDAQGRFFEQSCSWVPSRDDDQPRACTQLEMFTRGVAGLGTVEVARQQVFVYGLSVCCFSSGVPAFPADFLLPPDLSDETQESAEAAELMGRPVSVQETLDTSDELLTPFLAATAASELIGEVNLRQQVVASASTAAAQPCGAVVTELAGRWPMGVRDEFTDYLLPGPEPDVFDMWWGDSGCSLLFAPTSGCPRR